LYRPEHPADVGEKGNHYFHSYITTCYQCCTDSNCRCTGKQDSDSLQGTDTGVEPYAANDHPVGSIRYSSPSQATQENTRWHKHDGGNLRKQRPLPQPVPTYIGGAEKHRAFTGSNNTTTYLAHKGAVDSERFPHACFQDAAKEQVQRHGKGEKQNPSQGSNAVERSEQH